MTEKIKEKRLNYNLSNNNQDYILDPETKKTYKKGKKLGGGGFGEVYEFIDNETHEIRAAKIISLKKLEDPQSNEAYRNEYKFNNNLNYKYICKCYSTFKDDQNAYFILEYQPNKTLSELLNNRYSLTEIEVKHYCYELLLAIEYLHSRNIIHRDIKLSNVLLSDKMEVKLCDFGLAIENNSNNSKTICGTPNYIAPEILNLKINTNYSFEIDIWSFGVILYSLFFHKTPFESPSKGKTKKNIENIIYTFPDKNKISENAKNLIRNIFVKDPSQRPTIKEIKESNFFNNGNGIPKYLPTSTLNMKLSDEYMSNYVNEAIINNECLDNETKILEGTLYKSNSPMLKYNNSIENINENDENNDSEIDSDQYNSTDKEKNDKKENNLNNNNEKDKKSEKKFMRKLENKFQTLKINRSEKLFNFIKEYSLKCKSEKNNKIILNDFNSDNKNINKENDKNNDNNGNNKIKDFYINKSRNKSNNYIINNNSNKFLFSPNKEDLLSRETNKLSYFNSFGKISSDTINDSVLKKMNIESIQHAIDTIDNNKTTSKEKNTETNSINSNLFLSSKKLQLRNNSNEIFFHHFNEKSRMQKKLINIAPKKLNFDDIIVVKYIDISDKCGIGYILTNGDIGAYFNDGTKLILIKCTLNIVYIDSKGIQRKIFLEEIIDDNLIKKIKVLAIFHKKFIKNKRNKNDFNLNPYYDKHTVDVYVIKWAKTHKASFFLLSNKEIQVIFNDKTQIIFNIKNKTVLFINHLKQKFKEDMRLNDFSSFEMTIRVLYAKKVLTKL